jgi:hypothetical protein
MEIPLISLPDDNSDGMFGRLRTVWARDPGQMRPYYDTDVPMPTLSKRQIDMHIRPYVSNQQSNCKLFGQS